MDDAARARFEFLEEVARELYRRGVITDDILDTVAERLTIQATNHGPSQAGVLEHAAHMANMLPFEASREAVSQSERNAEFQRKQIRERTAMLANTDGGNAAD